MPGSEQPMLAIGLAVYNGQRYLSEAIDSILGQTFRDFRLIISDNASTDGTEAICRRYAGLDSRIRYIRQPENLGVAGNFNAVFEGNRSPFFRWAAHDDVLAPTYLERCVKRLVKDRSLAGVNSLIQIIDECGNAVRIEPEPTAMQSEQAFVRYATSLAGRERMIWSVMRSDFIRRTHLHGPFNDSELHFQAEMALQGRFAMVPEPLLRVRIHPGCYTVIAREWVAEDYNRWWGNARVQSSRWVEPGLLYRQAVSISRAPVSMGQKLRCWRLVGEEAGKFFVPIVRRNCRRVSDRVRHLMGYRPDMNGSSRCDMANREGKEASGHVQT